MAKTLTILFGVVYALLGVVALFANSFIGPAGFFAANIGYALVLIVAGLVLLGVGFWVMPAQLRTWDIVLGIVFALFGVLGFLVAPAGGSVLGLATNSADYWFNLILGVVLVGAGLLEGRESRGGRRIMREAT